MTKNQWIVAHREKRIKEKNLRNATPVSPNLFNEILKELYEYLYLPHEEVIIHLVSRYKEKLSPEYLKNHDDLMNEWKPEAKERAAKLMQDLIYCKNPFLSLIKPDNAFSGKHYPIPIK